MEYTAIARKFIPFPNRKCLKRARKRRNLEEGDPYLNAYKFLVTNNLFNAGFAIEAGSFTGSAKNPSWIFVLLLSKTHLRKRD
jgi:hypothetical protein